MTKKQSAQFIRSLQPFAVNGVVYLDEKLFPIHPKDLKPIDKAFLKKVTIINKPDGVD